MTEIDDRIVALVDDDVWPAPSVIVEAMADELDADEVAYTIGRLMDENKVLYVQVDGMFFLTTPQRWVDHNTASCDATGGG